MFRPGFFFFCCASLSFYSCLYTLYNSIYSVPGSIFFSGQIGSWIFFFKLDMCSKYTKAPACCSLPIYIATTFGCINFNNYFPNAQSDLLYILTLAPPQGMTQENRAEDLGLGKKHIKFQLPSINGIQVMISKRNTEVNVNVNLNVT